MDKTVIQVFKREIKKCNADCETMIGFGDFLRGTLTLYKLSKKYGFNLIIDFRHHPIGNYIDTVNLEYINIIDNNIDELKFFFSYNNLINYILNNNNNIICLLSNSYIDRKDINDSNTVNSILEDEQKFMKIYLDQIINLMI